MVEKRFSKEELFVIERDMDFQRSGMINAIINTERQLVHLEVMKFKNTKRYETLKKLLEEHTEAYYIYDAINKKCEKLRK